LGRVKPGGEQNQSQTKKNTKEQDPAALGKRVGDSRNGGREKRRPGGLESRGNVLYLGHDEAASEEHRTGKSQALGLNWRGDCGGEKGGKGGKTETGGNQTPYGEKN